MQKRRKRHYYCSRIMEYFGNSVIAQEQFHAMRIDEKFQTMLQKQKCDLTKACAKPQHFFLLIGKHS